uniref:P protein n=1 Tax=Zeugodacus cucurbitae sigmavirus-B2 TaxID=3159479 RepID=A0AAU7L0A5_9RHAB
MYRPGEDFASVLNRLNKNNPDMLSVITDDAEEEFEIKQGRLDPNVEETSQDPNNQGHVLRSTPARLGLKTNDPKIVVGDGCLTISNIRDRMRSSEVIKLISNMMTSIQDAAPGIKIIVNPEAKGLSISVTNTSEGHMYTNEEIEMEVEPTTSESSEPPPRKKITYAEYWEKLQGGISFTPYNRLLPGKNVTATNLGLTPEIAMTIIQENPEIEYNDFVISALKKVERGRKLLRAYRVEL